MTRGQVKLVVASLVLAVAVVPTGSVGAELDPAVRERAEAGAVQIGVATPIGQTQGGAVAYAAVASGSGTVVSPDGLVLTNLHVLDAERIAQSLGRRVVANKYVIAVTVDDGPPRPRYWADLAAAWPEADLAVLRITADWATIAPVDRAGLDLPYVPLGDSDAVNRADEVHVFGYPAVAGNTLQYTPGVISGFEVDPQSGARLWLRTDATISSGNSGGTAVNGAGELVGVPTQAGVLRCQPWDTNNDRSPDTCVPFGGALNMLRPVNLAKPLIDQAAGEPPPADDAGTASPSAVEP